MSAAAATRLLAIFLDDTSHNKPSRDVTKNSFHELAPSSPSRHLPRLHPPVCTAPTNSATTPHPRLQTVSPKAETTPRVKRQGKITMPFSPKQFLIHMPCLQQALVLERLPCILTWCQLQQSGTVKSGIFLRLGSLGTTEPSESGRVLSTQAERSSRGTFWLSSKCHRRPSASPCLRLPQGLSTVLGSAHGPTQPRSLHQNVCLCTTLYRQNLHLCSLCSVNTLNLKPQAHARLWRDFLLAIQVVSVIQTCRRQRTDTESSNSRVGHG